MGARAIASRLNRVIDRDLGMTRIFGDLRALRGSHVKVGVQQGEERKDASSMVVVAAANEFGTETIPERSFIRSTHDEKRETIFRIMAAEKSSILLGRKKPRESLDQVGIWMTGQIVAKIDSHPAPENAPATIERKGSSGTLVDTGALKQGIRHVVVMGGKQ